MICYIYQCYILVHIYSRVFTVLLDFVCVARQGVDVDPKEYKRCRVR